MDAIRIRGLDHVVLRVADLERSLGFYRDMLGCPVVRERDSGLTQLKAGSAMIDLVALDSKAGRSGGAGPGREGRNMEHFALNLKEFDEAAIRAHLKTFGVEVKKSGRRFGAEGYGPSVYFDDPDGNEVELKGPSEPGTARGGGGD